MKKNEIIKLKFSCKADIKKATKYLAENDVNIIKTYKNFWDDYIIKIKAEEKMLNPLIASLSDICSNPVFFSTKKY